MLQYERLRLFYAKMDTGFGSAMANYILDNYFRSILRQMVRIWPLYGFQVLSKHSTSRNNFEIHFS